MRLTTAHELADKVETILQKQWFFVTGFEKSGTTWLQKLLDSHREVRCIGEGHAVRYIGQPFQEMFNQYNSVITKTNEAVYNNENLGYQQLGVKTFHSMFMMMMAASIIDMPDESIKFFGDKTPNNITKLTALVQLFPNPKIFHIIRDPRDVLVSYTKHMSRTYDHQEYTYENSAGFLSKAWSERINLGKEFQQKFPNQLHEVRYEDLLVKPHEELKKMHQFLGVDSTDDEIAACVEANSFEKLSGGRKAGEENENSFYRKGVSGDWKEELSQEALDILYNLAGDTLKSLGYDDA